MKLLAATVMSLSVLSSVFAQTDPGGDSPTVTITRSGSQPFTKAPAEHFTGSVRMDPLFQANEPSRTSGAHVTFEPGARTAWHTHPLGQILIVTAGSGRVQAWGGPIEEIRPGDVVRILARQETLARSRTRHGDDAYRHPGESRRQDRRLAGKSQR